MESTPPHYNQYLLIHNISKPKNYGMLLRSAAAFDVRKIFLVSKNFEEKRKSKIFRDFNLFFGDKGTSRKLEYEVFGSIRQAKDYFVANGIRVCGVEITQDAQSINTRPFHGDTVFVLGNEGEGLIDALKNICDQFVYIPQYTDKTASLNVAVAGSIIFHGFAVWSNYKEAPIFGEKYQNLDAPTKTTYLHFKIHDSDQPGNQEAIKEGESSGHDADGQVISEE